MRGTSPPHVFPLPYGEFLSVATPQKNAADGAWINRTLSGICPLRGFPRAIPDSYRYGPPGRRQPARRLANESAALGGKDHSRAYPARPENKQIAAVYCIPLNPPEALYQGNQRAVAQAGPSFAPAQPQSAVRLPVGESKGGYPPLGRLLPCAESIALRGGPRGRPRSVRLSCVCVPDAVFPIPLTRDSTYKSAGGTLSGTTKERLRKQALFFGPARPQSAVCLPVGVPKGDSPLWWSFPPFCQQKGGPAGGDKGARDPVP